MKFGSVCSGIEAASEAWRYLGWSAAFFSEIEPFPSAVLAARQPGVPNHGDMNNFKAWPDATIDLLCGGTPCQSFSNAGLRAGLDDPRGQLMLTFGAIAARYRPKWLVWENVPGVLSSDGGRDFGAFLGLLGFLGYGFAYRVLDAQFVRVDGYGRAVPQRRNRVFVVGCLGDWRGAAAVLLERESLRGDSAPRREAGAGVAVGALAGTGPGSGWRIGADEAAAGHCVAIQGRTYGPLASPALKARDYKGPSSDGDGDGAPLIAHALPFDTTQITSAANRSNPMAGDPCHPLAAGAHAPAIAFNARQDPINGPIDTDGASNGVMVPSMKVRRLTPGECEALQGFPQGYTAIPWRGKTAADGPRYKALGNSWAVNCARWIGRRIDMVEGIHASRKVAA